MRLQADRESNTGRLESSHNAVRRRKSVRTTAGEHDRMHAFDSCRRMQQVRLSSSWAAAAYIDATNCALAGEHNRRPGQPAVAVRGVVADLKALDHQLILTDLSAHLAAMAAPNADGTDADKSGLDGEAGAGEGAGKCGAAGQGRTTVPFVEHQAGVLGPGNDIGAVIAIEVAD
jgi:hypothetical protein